MAMNFLWLISQDVNNGYDTYDSAVVCAASEEEARNTHPGYYRTWSHGTYSWVMDPAQVKVQRIGTAAAVTEPGVVCASFNAG